VVTEPASLIIVYCAYRLCS